MGLLGINVPIEVHNTTIFTLDDRSYNDMLPHCVSEEWISSLQVVAINFKTALPVWVICAVALVMQLCDKMSVLRVKVLLVCFSQVIHKKYLPQGSFSSQLFLH
jgi:hypothetical protein